MKCDKACHRYKVVPMVSMGLEEDREFAVAWHANRNQTHCTNSGTERCIREQDVRVLARILGRHEHAQRRPLAVVENRFEDEAPITVWIFVHLYRWVERH